MDVELLTMKADVNSRAEITADDQRFLWTPKDTGIIHTYIHRILNLGFLS